MSRIEKMNKYIKRTNIPKKTEYAYGLTYSETDALHTMPLLDCICLAFNYGMAKGYRAGKAAAKRHGSEVHRA